MSVVVTGAAGFIGAHLVRSWPAAPTRWVMIDRRPDAPAAASSHLVADLLDDDRDGGIGYTPRGGDALSMCTAAGLGRLIANGDVHAVEELRPAGHA